MQPWAVEGPRHNVDGWTSSRTALPTISSAFVRMKSAWSSSMDFSFLSKGIGSGTAAYTSARAMQSSGDSGRYRRCLLGTAQRKGQSALASQGAGEQGRSTVVRCLGRNQRVPCLCETPCLCGILRGCMRRDVASREKSMGSSKQMSDWSGSCPASTNPSWTYTAYQVAISRTRFYMPPPCCSIHRCDTCDSNARCSASRSEVQCSQRANSVLYAFLR